MAGVLPPSRTDVGTVLVAGDEATTGLRFSTGAHLASGVTRRDLPIDVGLGYVYERVGGPIAPVRSAESPPGQIVPNDHFHRDAHGAYVEVARGIRQRHGSRAWLGMRGEVMERRGAEERQTVAAGYARVAWELFTTGNGAGADFDVCSGGFGFAYGIVGIGLFVESGAQWVEGEGTAFVTTAGLSIRLPVIGGVVFSLCPRC